MNIRELKNSCAWHITRASRELVVKAIAAQFITNPWDKDSIRYHGAGRELFEGCGWVFILSNKNVKGVAHYVFPKKEWDALFTREKKKIESTKASKEDREKVLKSLFTAPKN